MDLSCSFGLFLHLHLQLFKPLVIDQLILVSSGKKSFCHGLFVQGFWSPRFSLLRLLQVEAVGKKNYSLHLVRFDAAFKARLVVSDLQHNLKIC